MEFLNFVEDVLFVIVVYKQPIRTCAAFQSIKLLRAKFPGSFSIFVYDNSPEAQALVDDTIEYRHDASNPGVSRAYNRAFEYAKDHQFRFLFFLDQDSSFSEQTLRSYSQSVAKYNDVHVFAAAAKHETRFFSPFRLMRGRGSALPTLEPGLYSLKKIKVINSGLLVSIAAFEKSGGYDEDFPLDFSDIAFCDRLAKNDFKLCLTEGEIEHRHSSKEKHSASQRKIRFQLYLNALIRYKKSSDQNVSYWIGGFFSAMKLTGQYSDLSFLKTFFLSR